MVSRFYQLLPTVINRGVCHCFWHCWVNGSISSTRYLPEREDAHLRTLGAS